MCFLIVLCSVLGQSRAIDKACDGVAVESRKAVQERAQKEAAGGGSLGAVSKSVRSWVKSELPGVPDACAVEIVRAVVQDRDDAKRRADKVAADAANKLAWAALSEVQKQWVQYVADGNETTHKCPTFKVGMMGEFEAGATVLNVISETDLLVEFECRWGYRGEHREQASAWITGVDTRGVVTGQAVQLGYVLWISGTKTYTTAIGGSRTVFYMERIPEGLTLKGMKPPR